MCLKKTLFTWHKTFYLNSNYHLAAARKKKYEFLFLLFFIILSSGQSNSGKKKTTNPNKTKQTNKQNEFFDQTRLDTLGHYHYSFFFLNLINIKIDRSMTHMAPFICDVLVVTKERISIIIKVCFFHWKNFSILFKLWNLIYNLVSSMMMMMMIYLICWKASPLYNYYYGFFSPVFSLWNKKKLK